MKDVGPCAKDREEHHWHDSDRQPLVKTIKYQVCCHCSQSREVRGVPAHTEGCGRYEINPKVKWDYAGADAREIKREKTKEEKTKKLDKKSDKAPVKK